MVEKRSAISRRDFLKTASILAGASLAFPTASLALAGHREFRLKAAPSMARLVSEDLGETPVWAYSGTVPGPEIRVRQGQNLRIAVENRLAEETTVHWHGIRTPNSMDGVPHLTQQPIEPGGEFVYEFAALDAGTFWYHPHQRSFEQVGRGLYGPLIVEEAEPIRVDREVTWVLDDWRLSKSAAISDDFGNNHDMMHGGRVGNTVTINGKIPDSFPVKRGERIRLRLINAANARIFALDFADLEPVIVALDGQPVTPHVPSDNVILLGPAMRADLVVDMTGEAGSRMTVVDSFYEGLAYRLKELIYANDPFREQVPDWPIELAANPLSEPDIGKARRHEIHFNGGMMGQMVMREMGGSMGNGSGMMGSMMNMMHGDGMWFINGKAATGHVMEPMLTLEQGYSYVLSMTNATAWHHPIHLHGHSFRVVARDGAPTQHKEWQDTVLMAPREKVDIAFVADNLGDWMFHCHILEHQAAGMMGVIRVAGGKEKT